MNADSYKRAAAARAIDFVRSGMRLGLGTGSTAQHFVELLADRVRAGLEVIAVPTSEATRAQAAQLGIALATLDEVPELDLTVDGADEIGPDLMRTLVFDLDGTLVDTAPDLVSTLNLILGREGLPPAAYDAARRMIGGGAHRMIERALNAEGRSVTPAELDRMFGMFVEHYSVHIADRSRPFPQVEHILQRFASEGFRLAVCTNKLEWLSRRLLELLNLSRYFKAICGQDTFGIQKPDPQMLRLTIGRAGGDVQDAIMIGDSITDIRTARAANVPVIAVDFGYSEVAPAALNADRVISSFAELPSAIAAIGGNEVAAAAAPLAGGGPQ